MPEYLVSYGAEGFLARCACDEALACERGDRVLIRSHRGVEPAEILGDASAEHARFLPDRMMTRLLRPLDGDVPGDDLLHRRDRIFAEAARLAQELELPIEVVDVEVLLEPRTIIVHYLRFESGKLRQLVRRLAERFHALIEMQDLNLGVATEYGDAEHERYCNSDRKVGGGCGSGSCGNGSCGNGSCGNHGSGGCGSGGCGSCGSSRPAALPVDDLITELAVKIPKPVLA